MAIKAISKKIIKGQAIVDLQKQIKDSFNVINSAALNVDAAIKEMKKDPDFTLDEMQEFKNILTYALDETMKGYDKWEELFNSIVLE
jgi:hypothetical protein